MDWSELGWVCVGYEWVSGAITDRIMRVRRTRSRVLAEHCILLYRVVRICNDNFDTNINLQMILKFPDVLQYLVPCENKEKVEIRYKHYWDRRRYLCTGKTGTRGSGG